MKPEKYLTDKNPNPIAMPVQIVVFGVLLILSAILGIVYYVIMAYTVNNKYTTIGTPHDWDKHKPECKGKCINYIMFIEKKGDYEFSQSKLNMYTGNTIGGLPLDCRIYYLKHPTPDIMRYIENNWSYPTTYPRIGSIFKRSEKEWIEVE